MRNIIKNKAAEDDILCHLYCVDIGRHIYCSCKLVSFGFSTFSSFIFWKIIMGEHGKVYSDEFRCLTDPSV